MKKSSKAYLFIVLALVIAFAFLSISGLATAYGDTETVHFKGLSSLEYGSDFAESVKLSFSPAEGTQPSQAEVNGALEIFEQRLAAYGISGYELNADGANITLVYPASEDEHTAAEISELLTGAFVCTVREGYSPEGVEVTEDGTLGTVLFDAQDIKGASAVTYTDASGNYKYGVKLTLSKEGRAIFAEASERLIGTGYISIWLDTNVVSYAQPSEKIDQAAFVIQGDYTLAEALELAAKIDIGALSTAYEASEPENVGASLGANASTALLTGIAAAVVVVCVVLIIAYRSLGAVTAIALVGQTVFSLAVTTGFFGFAYSTIVTVPLIAGLLTGLIMCVCTGIGFAEKVRYEMKNGKSAQGAFAASGSRYSAGVLASLAVFILAVVALSAFADNGGIFSKILFPFFFLFKTVGSGALNAFCRGLMFASLGNMIFTGLMRLMSASIISFNGLCTEKALGMSAKGTTLGKSVSKIVYIFCAAVVVAAGIMAFVLPAQISMSWMVLIKSAVAVIFAAIIVALIFAQRYKKQGGFTVAFVVSALVCGLSSAAVYILFSSRLSGEAIAFGLFGAALALFILVVFYDAVKVGMIAKTTAKQSAERAMEYIVPSLVKSTLFLLIGFAAACAVSLIFFGGVGAVQYSLLAASALISLVAGLCFASVFIKEKAGNKKK